MNRDVKFVQADPVKTKRIVRKIKKNKLHMEVVFRHVLMLGCYYLIIKENDSNFEA